jgi:hypothetical protein
MAVLQDLSLRLEAVGHRGADMRNCEFAPSRFAATGPMKQLTAAPIRYGPLPLMVERALGGVFRRSKMHGTWSD